jgi:hypothetical protein
MNIMSKGVCYLGIAEMGKPDFTHRRLTVS